MIRYICVCCQPLRSQAGPDTFAKLLRSQIGIMKSEYESKQDMENFDMTRI